MRDDLSGLRALLSVAEKRGFRAAAADLRLTPSAISQAVRALEERVGVRLLERTTRSVALSEAGRRFVEQVRPAMASIGEAFDALGELRDRPAGNLRLTLARVAYADVLKPRIGGFLEQYPDIRLELHADDALADVVADGFDAGLRLGETVETEMVAVRVSPDQSVAVVGSPAYFASHGKPEHPRELEAHDCINLRLPTSGAIYRWEFSENGKDLEVAVNGRVTTNDGQLVVDAAVGGLGLAYVFQSMVREELASKRLVRVLEQYCPPFPGYFIYYPSRVHMAPKLKAFVDFMRYRQTGSTARAPRKKRGRKRRSSKPR
jgi:DNA-binding transcriptional LysR family regulator